MTYVWTYCESENDNEVLLSVVYLLDIKKKTWKYTKHRTMMRRGLICNNTRSRYAYAAASGHIYYQLHYPTTEGSHKCSYKYRWPNNQRRQHKQYQTPFSVVVITQTI